MRYLGHLSRKDPLYGYLGDDILPQLGVHGHSPDFRVYRIQASNDVYLYEDQVSRAQLIGKFFQGIKHRSPEHAAQYMEQEFNSLNHLRGIGFNCNPHYIPRPLGCNADINCVLVEEFCRGISLDIFIVEAIREGKRQSFFRKLTDLACFLATLHNRTATSVRVDMGGDLSYFDRILDQLKKRGNIGWAEAEDFNRLKEDWQRRGFMWEDNQVLVHGDVTPSNLLFDEGLGVIAIDLERMKLADRVFDAGRMAAEIKHFFMQYTGNKWLAEPFIGHFLWEYAGHFPDRDSAFRSIVRRVPCFMGMTLLRIARNPWISEPYRRQLLDEARETLR